MDRLRAEVIEEAYALPQQHVGNAHLKFVEQARLQGLLDRTGPVKGDTFLACKLLRLGNSALDTIGDEVKLRLALLHGFSRL